ncbi:hypothetical protein ANANG_G00314600 [Anguilla anguilla]|uniref:Uncharacterized protein n=1 Tax=Anguilla anguilla TaxID=7936 RepID=A0A9D3RK58_ANGAN|nr:hypothetical protein ANANG_G00314600 [Anguilla anguilla]
MQGEGPGHALPEPPVRHRALGTAAQPVFRDAGCRCRVTTATKMSPACACTHSFSADFWQLENQFCGRRPARQQPRPAGGSVTKVASGNHRTEGVGGAEKHISFTVRAPG